MDNFESKFDITSKSEESDEFSEDEEENTNFNMTFANNDGLTGEIKILTRQEVFAKMEDEIKNICEITSVS